MEKALSYYESKVKQNSFFQMVILLFAVFGAIVTINEVYGLASKLIEPSKEEKAISLLGVNKNYTTFSQKIGNSDYKEVLKIHNENDFEEKIIIYHYSLVNSFISLFTDENNIVIAYTLVAKNPNKRLPVPKIMDDYSNGTIYLNSFTPLSEFHPTPYKVYVYNTTRDTHYTEIIGTGSYAGYNYYLLGFTQVGFIPEMEPISQLYLEVSKQEEEINKNYVSHPSVKKYRTKIIPNAYGEIYRNASDVFLQTMLERPIGPDKHDLAIND